MKGYIGFIFLCCIAVTCGNPIQSRVVGGSDAEEGKYPYQVMLRYGAMFLCGGSILNKHYILTAAHCVYKRKANMIIISTGSYDIKGGDEYYFASALIPHEGFTSMDIEDIKDDIALIRVDKEIKFSDKVQPIRLPDKDFDNYNSFATLTGWGKTETSGGNPKLLQAIELTVITQRNCKDAWKQLQESNICTLTKLGEGACSGDSGGPLVSSGVQIGIVSFGQACAQGVPDVFTRVYSYLDWIKEHMKIIVVLSNYLDEILYFEKNEIINRFRCRRASPGFRTCGLYPFKADAVNYNILSKKTKENSSITDSTNNPV